MTGLEVSRRLAAIVFVDIVGYTERSHRDETAALAIRRRVHELVRDRCLTRRGRIVKSLGDGTLLEFSSTVEAVSCAIEIQEQMGFHFHPGLPNPVKVRIGIHVGEVVEEQGDVLGNAVNIASRVHAMAHPGSICITRDVYTQIRPILKLRCRRVSVGEKDRVPTSIEVLQIDEAQGSTSHTLQAVKRPSRSLLWPGIAALSMLISIGSLAYAFGWIPARSELNGHANDTRSNSSTSGSIVTPKDDPAPPNEMNPRTTTSGTLESPISQEELENSGRSNVSIISEEQSIPFQTQVVYSAQMQNGRSRVRQDGMPGIAEVRYEVKTADGKEISRRMIKTVVKREPRTRIVEMGRRVRPPQEQSKVSLPWFCPECGERRIPAQAVCPNDGSRRP